MPRKVDKASLETFSPGALRWNLRKDLRKGINLRCHRLNLRASTTNGNCRASVELAQLAQKPLDFGQDNGGYECTWAAGISIPRQSGASAANLISRAALGQRFDLMGHENLQTEKDPQCSALKGLSRGDSTHVMPTEVPTVNAKVVAVSLLSGL